MVLNLARFVNDRKVCAVNPRLPSQVASSIWIKQASLSTLKLFKRVHNGAITHVDLDKVEGRYLLSCSGDATIAIYDTQNASTSRQELDPVGVVTKNNRSGHQYMITCVTWYPIDTGMFVSCSHDRKMKIWDANTLEAVCDFTLECRMLCCAMSDVATSHCLVATASEDPLIRLCDPMSGALAHVLSGHRSSCTTVAWSGHSEYELLSGDTAGQVRVWDIRRAGCRQMLDQYCTQPQRPVSQPVAKQGGRSGNKKFKRGEGSSCPGGSTPLGTGGASTALALAHHGPITSLTTTSDGLHVVTGSTDCAARLWDARLFHHLLVNYEGQVDRQPRARQACMIEGQLYAAPSRSTVQVYDMLSGQVMRQLGPTHFGRVHCCAYNSLLKELYSGGADGQILTWDLMSKRAAELMEENGQDTWSP